MVEKRVVLYERLPEIYLIKDQEQSPAGQLASFLGLVEEIFAEIHKNIEFLYDDLFIETCSDWVIPYIGDLLGTSHLRGDPWTLRADVADTIALRRRKGTLGAIELLTYNLSQWGVHCLELKENLVLNQHLNHQRPDRGGVPPHGLPAGTQAAEVMRNPPARHQAVRGGTVTLRDPAMLSLLNTPFDPFGHVVDLKPPVDTALHYNLPNLAVFLWRLESYRVVAAKPVIRELLDNSMTATGAEAPFIVCFDVHPLGEPLQLFNSHRFDPDRRPPVITRVDETPGPIPAARLNQDCPEGKPQSYVTVETYDENQFAGESLDVSEAGLQLHLPDSRFSGETWPKPEGSQAWTIRGANLCSCHAGLNPPLRDREIAIDPVIGRIAMGVDTFERADSLANHLLVTHCYGSVGPVGAQPLSRPSSPQQWCSETVETRVVNFHLNADGLKEALTDIQDSPSPIVIEIHDSMTHELDLATLGGVVDEDGGPNIRINRSLIIRAIDNQRPVIKLRQPLRFRPTHVKGAGEAEQALFDAVMDNLTVRLEGLYISRSTVFSSSAEEPLIARAALHSLELIDCTLDPGGSRKLDGTAAGSRKAIRSSMRLCQPYGFTGESEVAFKQTPEIILSRCITGPLFLDSAYLLFVTDSIIDGGSGAGDGSDNASFALSGTDADPASAWGPPAQINGATFFGRVRVASISGRGGIWVHRLEVQNNQKGCIRYSYFPGSDDRVPQNLGCVTGKTAKLLFVSEVFGHPAYGQLALSCDRRIREQGPKRLELPQSRQDFLADRDMNYAVTFEGEKVYKLGDQMGAFGFVLEAHKWRNIRIRYREFMMVDVRPILIPVS